VGCGAPTLPRPCQFMGFPQIRSFLAGVGWVGGDRGRTWQQACIEKHLTARNQWRQHSNSLALFDEFDAMLSHSVLSFFIVYRFTNLSIIAVFVDYLRQFVIDLNQIYRHSSMPQNTSPEFFELFSSSGFRVRRRRDFFVTLCLSRCSESLDCLTLA